MSDEPSPELRRFLLRHKLRSMTAGLLNRHPAAPPVRTERPEDRRRRHAVAAEDLDEPDVVDLMDGAGD